MATKITNDGQNYQVEFKAETPKVTVADFVRKLTSRKFWISVATMVFLIMVYVGADENQATQVVAIIMAGATAIGYLIGEGLADSSSPSNDIYVDGVGYPGFTEVKDDEK